MRILFEGQRQVLLLLVIIAFSMLVSSCTPPVSTLAGQWWCQDTEEAVEFFADNTFAYDSDLGRLSGKWSILRDGRVKLDMRIMGTDAIFLGTIDRDGLSIDFAEGGIDRFTRQKPGTSVAGLKAKSADKCSANLEQIAGAKEQWAFANNADTSATPSTSDVKTYLSNNEFPSCPGGGSYSINDMASEPTCSVGGTHRIR